MLPRTIPVPGPELGVDVCSKGAALSGWLGWIKEGETRSLSQPCTHSSLSTWWEVAVVVPNYFARNADCARSMLLKLNYHGRSESLLVSLCCCCRRKSCWTQYSVLSDSAFKWKNLPKSHRKHFLQKFPTTSWVLTYATLFFVWDWKS